MRLLICGGRNFIDVEYAIPRFQQLHQKTPVSVLICGMAAGGDMIGYAWASELGIPIEEYPVLKEDWRRHGKAAGTIRNFKMRDQGKPNIVLALPGGNGTAHMCRIVREIGIEPIEYKYRYFSRARDPELGFLSNFYKFDQYDDDGVIYPTNEHYYQCEKTLDDQVRQWLYDASDASTVKRRGNANTIPLRPDWETFKLEAMMNGLRMKFRSGTAMADQLLQTNDGYLVEFAPWGDRFWGVDKNKKGQNWLGRLLMRRREEIRTGRLYR